MLRLLLCAAVTLVAVGTLGCSGDRVEERNIEVKQKGALDEARQVLEGYAKGNPLSSEVDSFPDLVKRVQEEDAAKAKVLEDAFKRIQSTPADRATIARETLKKL